MCKSGSYAKFKVTEEPTCTLVSWNLFVVFAVLLPSRTSCVLHGALCNTVYVVMLMVCQCAQWPRPTNESRHAGTTPHIIVLATSLRRCSGTDAKGQWLASGITVQYHQRTYIMGILATIPRHLHQKPGFTNCLLLTLMNHHCSLGRNEPVFLLRVDLGGS